MKGFSTLIIIFSSLNLFSQSTFRQFKKLSLPEKYWAITHPLKAKKAFRTTKAVLSDVDSIKKIGIIGADLNGGTLDAFKHSYWMACLTIEIGHKKAIKLGCAHEKGNKLEFVQRQLEDAVLPDSVSSAMDLHNNGVGADAVKKCETISKKILQERIINLLKEGKLLTIKKDKAGNYLFCDGTFIDMNEWKGKWNIPKCLIPSNIN